MRLPMSYWTDFPPKGVNERNYSPSIVINQGFAVYVLWEATKREIMYWAKT